jgi:catechol 2,3-dioxygenase-like lactoylglutathione lyase family enzyme
LKVEKLDFVGVPSRDPDRTRAFYTDTLGSRADEHSKCAFWSTPAFATWRRFRTPTATT